MASTVFNMTTASNYLKTKYGPAGQLMYNSNYPVSGLLEKDYDWKGGNFEEPIVLSQGVGVGSGAKLPEAGVEKTTKVSFADKNVYARAVISNKLIEKAVGGESAFIDAYKDKWEKTQKGFSWFVEMCLHAYKASAPGSGALGTLTTTITGSGTSADPWICPVTAATWKQFNWEAGILVNCGTYADVYEVAAITPATPSISLVRTTGDAGTHTPTSGDVVYMQNSKDVAILSIPDVLLATSSTLYGANVGYGWQAHQQLAVGTVVDEELIDNAVLDIEAQCGEGIDYIFTSRKQWKILKSANVGLKRYQVDNPNVPAKFAAKLGFTALEYLSPVGSKVVPILYSRFMADDQMWLINKRRARIKHTNKPKWFERDGTVFLRTPDGLDNLEARFYSYMETYLYPTFHGIITGLS